jgi:hypothetical protein
MEKAVFTLEGEIFVEGIHNPHKRWNGWAMPLLPLASVVKVAEWLESIGANVADGGIPVVIDGVPHWESLDEMTETTVETHRIDPTVIDGVEYFSIGAGGWCWDDVPNPVRSEPCDECGANLYTTTGGDDWGHEDTPTAHECFTARIWGLIERGN